MSSERLRIHLILFLLLIYIVDATAQTVPDDYLDLLNHFSEEEDISIESLIEDLLYYYENPINIQVATKHDLEKLFFLTEKQVEGLLYYLYKYGPLVDIYELKNVEELDRQTIYYLLPFIYVGQIEDEGKINSADLLKKGKHEALLRTNFTAQRKAGYAKVSEEEKKKSPGKYYTGEPYYLSLRYNYNYEEKIWLGFIGEKDPGETLFSPEVKGFDHLSYNLTIKNRGRIRMLSLGDYKLAYGEGLVVNNHFAIGKTYLGQATKGIRRHVSSNENDYFRGIAGNIELSPDLMLSIFYSDRKHDANVDGDRIKTFLTTGYNRTYNELQKKDAAKVQLSGGNITWKYQSWTLGATLIYYSFGGKRLDPEPRDYNRYYLRDKDHYNAGLSYRYRKGKIVLSGETAVDKSKSIATINHLFYKQSSLLDIHLLFRHYDKQYNALYAKSFSEASSIQNETGCYAEVRFYPRRLWEIKAGWDYFRFPYQKYGINAPSSGNEYQLRFDYSPRKSIQMNIRYRYKVKSKNITLDKETFVLPYTQNKFRYQLDYLLSTELKLKSQIHYNTYKDIRAQQKGWSISQQVSYSPRQLPLTLDAAFIYFDSPEWNTRISSYEKNILYAGSYLTYYGRGVRYYLNLKWVINRSLSFYCKLSNSYYSDRENISSGTEEIDGNNKTDLYFLLRYKF